MRRKNPQRLVKCIIKKGVLKPQEFRIDDNIDAVLRADLGNGTFKYCYDLGQEGKQIVFRLQRLSQIKTIIEENGKFPDYFVIRNDKVMYNADEVEINGCILNWESLPEEEISKNFNVVVAQNVIKRRRENNHSLENPPKRRKNSHGLLTQNEQQKEPAQEINPQIFANSANKISIARLLNPYSPTEIKLNSTSHIPERVDLNHHSNNPINNPVNNFDSDTLFGHQFKKETIALINLPKGEESTSFISNTSGSALPDIAHENPIISPANNPLNASPPALDSENIFDTVGLIDAELTRQDNEELNFSDLFYR